MNATRIGLVSCVKSKLPSAAPAAELYVSPLFRGARRHVEASCDRWFILSALHGLVDPDAVLDPYELTLTTMGVRDRRVWSTRVLGQLDERIGDPAERVFEIHAGRAYYAHGLADGLRQAGARVEIPVEGLMLGQRLAYYASAGGDLMAARAAGQSRRP